MIKVHTETEKVCVAKAKEADQSHLFDTWDDLTQNTQRRLITDLQSISFQQVKRLVHQHRQGTAQRVDVETLQPPVVETPWGERADSDRGDEAALREQRDHLREVGIEALRAGKVALVMLSGGSGTGVLSEPTGMLPVGPVTGKSVFQLHAERIRALNLRYKTTLRWYIVVHPDAVDSIQTFFKENNHFGLNASAVVMLPQPQLPLIDRRGKFMLQEPGRLTLRPNGHGGVVEELFDEKRLAKISAGGIEHFYFFQVDNPLVRIADPLFVGHHLESGTEVSSKSVRRLDADEDVGIFCRAGDTTGVVEFSEFPEDCRSMTSSDGGLAFDAGNLAVHLFRTEFFERMARENLHLPFHAVERCVPCIDRRGKPVRPTEPNCFEFRCYLFDALWLAKSSSVINVPREDEFSPIKNTGGSRSPQTAQRDLSCLYTRWLRRCGASFTATAENSPPAIEISPLFALDEEELRSKIELPMEIEGDLFLSEV